MAGPLPVHRVRGDVRGGGPSSRQLSVTVQAWSPPRPSREVGLSLLRGELEAASS